MNVKQVDLLNVGLIILSAILAINFPLELFIFSFAILGPLHYLTEINWLDKNRYFVPTKNRIWLWVGLATALMIVFPKFYFYMYPKDQSSLAVWVSDFNNWTNAFILITLLLAIGTTFFKNKIAWGVLLLIGAISAYFLKSNESYNVWIGLFVPTVIHVFGFTILFMLYGAKKSGSKIGYLAVAIALFVPIMISGIDIDQKAYLFSDSMKSMYLENSFHVAPVLFAKSLGLSEGKSFFFYETLELRLMMFFSFIYLYHYLNWFSKTSLIKWHKNLNWTNSTVIVVMWITMLGLFYYNFRLGFIVALFFSILHVILEFPLNMVSVKGIFEKKKVVEVPVKKGSKPLKRVKK